MNKFEIGDKVTIREGSLWYGLLNGVIGEVHYKFKCDGDIEVLWANGLVLSHSADYLELVPNEQMTNEKHHKHHDLIIAWAKGAKIQFLLKDGSWFNAAYPSWDDSITYRIAPDNDCKSEIESIESDMRVLANRLSKLRQ